MCAAYSRPASGYMWGAEEGLRYLHAGIRTSYFLTLEAEQE